MARKSRKHEYLNSSDIQSDVNDPLLYDSAVTRCSADIDGNNGTIRKFAGFRAGLYARLSLESEANRERNTIENQMELLKSFVAGKNDIEAVSEYYDISRTGTDFDRPGFADMMQDIREQKINCVIVKDDRVIIRTKLGKARKIKGFALI
ncbi:MAG: recombinase family protein [Lachnospiraceae bacterium]|nr:recombinase family protein [Lachnospiraceae bacterium]